MRFLAFVRLTPRMRLRGIRPLLTIALFAVVSAAASCRGPVSANSIYLDLVSANCMAPSDAGPAAVAAEHALPDEDVWMACLWKGGSVQSCNVPCGP